MAPGDFVQAIVVGGCVLTALFLTVIAMKAWQGDKYLCDTCQYNDAESCKKTERPQAIECMAFRTKENAGTTGNTNQ